MPSAGIVAPERSDEEPVGEVLASERLPEEPSGKELAREQLERSPVADEAVIESFARELPKGLPSSSQEPIIIEDDPEEIPWVIPRRAAKEYLRIGAIEEEGEFMEFDERAEEEEIIQLMEHTTEAEKLFMVSRMHLLIPLLELLS